MQEPKDGDFVAYVEALQRESAARLLQQHVGVVSAATAESDAKSGHFFEDKKKTAARVPAINQAVERVLRDGDRALVKALVAAVIGVVALLLWFARGGALSFLVAVVLLAYALPRLINAFRAITTTQPANRTVVNDIFGKPGKLR